MLTENSFDSYDQSEAFDNLLGWVTPLIKHGNLHGTLVGEAEQLAVTICSLLFFDFLNCWLECLTQPQQFPVAPQHLVHIPRLAEIQIK